MNNHAYLPAENGNCVSAFEQIKYRTIRMSSQNFSSEIKNSPRSYENFPSEFKAEKDEGPGHVFRDKTHLAGMFSYKTVLTLS